jgi:predicted XRE-type DNA-binding protein
MLLKEFLEPMGLTQRELALGIRVPYQRVNELVNGRRGVTVLSENRIVAHLLLREWVASGYSAPLRADTYAVGCQ